MRESEIARESRIVRGPLGPPKIARSTQREEEEQERDLKKNNERDERLSSRT